MTLTIFTPTYNRAYCIQNLYNSLVQQTIRDFVWLVVDDGSTDNTESLLRSFIAEGKITIQYVKQLNGGKHTAINRGIQECATELFFCVDSDDYLTTNAVEIILNTVELHYNENLLGFYFRKIHEDGTNVASDYPHGIDRIGISDLYHKYDFSGDTAIVLWTKDIKNYRFPVFEGERFVTERVLYNELNNIAPMLLCEDPIYVCEYLADGYTKNAVKLTLNNPYGSSFAFLSESIHANNLLQKAKNYAQYLALIRIFSLNCRKFPKIQKPSIQVKILGLLFSSHYIRLYKRILDCLQ
jgi:glycosyltransferase involved in cell wall biosynthesis